MLAARRKRSRSLSSHASSPCSAAQKVDQVCEIATSPEAVKRPRPARISDRISVEANGTSPSKLDTRPTLRSRAAESVSSPRVKTVKTGEIAIDAGVLPVLLSPVTTAQATPSSRTVAEFTDADDVSRRLCPQSAPSSLPRSRGAMKSPVGQPTRSFLVGDIVWAHMSGHPWWPAMIAYEPNSGMFTDANKRRWHVQFFGQDPLRAWVGNGSMVPFESAEQFTTLPKRSPATVSARHQASWTLGVNDAVRAYGMSKQQRRQCFTFKYKMSQPDKMESPDHALRSRKRARCEDEADTTSSLASIACSPKRLKTNSRLETLVNDVEKCNGSSHKGGDSIPLETPPISETASVDMDASAPSEAIRLPTIRKPTSRRHLTEVACSICNEECGDEKVSVCNNCGDIFHLDCLGLAHMPQGFLCDECTIGVKACFVCKRNDGSLTSCASNGCKKSFHMDCIANFLFKKTAHQGIICPLHTCETCSYLGNSRRAKLVRCSRCPVVYHATDSCLPAGYQRGTGHMIVCPRHARRQKVHQNLSWCFDCGGGGKLVCCDRCPSAFHPQCLPSNDPERQTHAKNDDLLPSPLSQLDDSGDVASLVKDSADKTLKASLKRSSIWLCPDCRHGRWLHVSNLVWCKLGKYRWWPAKIVPDESVPPCMAKKAHGVGEFVVRFFGTHDFSFVTHGNTFSFNRRDTPALSHKTLMDKRFHAALQEAREELDLMEAEECERQKHRRAPYHAIPKNQYNLLTPQERRSASSHPHAHHCVCTPEMACGDNDCDNRSQYFECSSRTCPNGEKCQNQRFQRRQYAPVKSVYVGKRGWGLKATAKIEEDDFVIEYVGEVLTNKLFEERLAEKEDVQRLCYALRLEEKFVVDAGCKGNLARFINHSCSPNLVAQKWIVNQQTRVGLFALHDIEPDTELTFDYKWADSKMSNMECFCGAPNCSGVVGLSTQAKAAPALKEKKKKKLKKKAKAKKVTEELCFECGEGGELLICDRKSCGKVYHLACLHLESTPTGAWWCPWHVCDVCGSASRHFCTLCSTSYCLRHVGANLHDTDSGARICSHHS